MRRSTYFSSFLSFRLIFKASNSSFFLPLQQLFLFFPENESRFLRRSSAKRQSCQMGTLIQEYHEPVDSRKLYLYSGDFFSFFVRLSTLDNISSSVVSEKCQKKGQVPNKPQLFENGKHFINFSNVDCQLPP